MKTESPLVITISRQLGSGGAYVGQQLSKRLNISYIDREIIREAANQLSILEADLEAFDEKKISFWQSIAPLYSNGVPDIYMPPQIYIPTDRELFQAESQIIERIAKNTSSIIIGRCGSHILCEHPNHMSIFLHADMAFRKERIQTLYNVPKEAAEKMIQQSDTQRGQYHRKFTGKEWIDVRQYNLSMDTGKLGIENTIELILKHIESLLERI